MNVSVVSRTFRSSIISELRWNNQSMEKNIWITSAAALARRLHKGQVDKAGLDYFVGHLSTVASMGRTWQEQVVGYLHDASEDTPHTVGETLALLEEEAQQRLGKEDREELATALHLLNHHNSPNRDAYIRAIGEHPRARAVKLNDLRHNMDLSRLSSPSSKDLARRERYEREYSYLSSISAERLSSACQCRSERICGRGRRSW